MATVRYKALNTALRCPRTLPSTDQGFYPRNRGASCTEESLTCQTRKPPFRSQFQVCVSNLRGNTKV